MTKEEIEKMLNEKLKVITDDIVRELTNLKIIEFTTKLKLESYLRQEIAKNYTSPDQLMDSIDEFREFNQQVSKLIGIPAILDRVSQAMKYNETANFKIYADDLNFVSQIEAAAGCLPSVAEAILTLPHSNRVEKYFEKWLHPSVLVVDPKETVPVA